MRVVGIILVALMGLGYGYLGETALKVGDQQLPPIAKFMNPYYGYWANAEPINPIGQRFYNLPSLDKEAKVFFDDNMIPHIYAESTMDAYRLQGFIHASQRLWQMDMISRSAGGRIAEIVGESGLDHDLYQRRIGMLYAAENALKGVKQHPETFAYFEAFCEGANTYIHQLKRKDYPLEYKLMNFKPREWQPIDIMLVFKQMAYDLCFKNNDIKSTITRQYIQPETYDSLFTINDYTDPVIPHQENWSEREIEAIAQSSIYEYLKFPLYIQKEDIDPNNGSNNWAVNGVKTASGSPMLASDPHLGLTLPSVWYENHLNSPDLNVYGVSIPGMPAVLIGFNDYISWGETNVGHDVAEWNMLDWEGSDFSTYTLDSIEYQTEKRVEKIAVKGADTVAIDIYLTKAGIVSYTDNPQDASYGLAFHWLAHDTQDKDELSTFLNLNKAQNLIEYQEAIKTFAAPAQNFAFASVEGDIAITTQGKFPIKDKGSGKFIEKITSSDQLYQSYIPNKLIPRQINPKRNYIASANQISTSEDYPYYYNSVQFEHFRNRYLNSVLDTLENIQIRDFEDLQLSDYSKEAEYVLSTTLPILENLNLSSEEQEILNSLKDWDYTFTRNAVAPVQYSYFTSSLMQEAWDEWEIPENKEILEYPSIYNTIKLIEEGKTLSLMLHKDDGSSYESIPDLLHHSFSLAVKKFNEAIHKNPDIRWSDYKGTVIKHLAGIDAFSTGLLPTGGHHSALNAQKNAHGPSWRMIVSMDNPVQAYGIYPGGQSGNPGSPFYDNMMDDWVEGRYHELYYSSDPDKLKSIMKTWNFSNK